MARKKEDLPKRKKVWKNTKERRSEMAKYQGKSVRLNKPSRITKGQPGYSLVLLEENLLELDINVQLLKTKQQQDIGLARNGSLCLERKEKEAQ